MNCLWFFPKAATSCLAAGGVGSGRCGAAQCLCLDNPRWLCTEPRSHGKQHKCCLKTLTAAQQLLALGFLSILPAMDGQQWSWKGQERLYLYSPLLQGKRPRVLFGVAVRLLACRCPWSPVPWGGRGCPCPSPVLILGAASRGIGKPAAVTRQSPRGTVSGKQAGEEGGSEAQLM